MDIPESKEKIFNILSLLTIIIGSILVIFWNKENLGVFLIGSSIGSRHPKNISFYTYEYIHNIYSVKNSIITLVLLSAFFIIPFTVFIFIFSTTITSIILQGLTFKRDLEH